MKTLLTLCALLLGGATAFSARIETNEVQSASMHKGVKACVVLPEGYASGGKRYPVVYMLHGYSGNYQSWVKDFPEMTRLVDLYNVIVVSPDGGFSSWYLDSPVDKSWCYETFVSHELVGFIDAKYSTITNRTGRAISGLSMGGHGALYLSFRHQEVFGAAGSMSGGVDIRPFPNNWNLAERLGDYAGHKQNWEDNTVINQVHLLRPGSLAVMIDCGTSDFFYGVNKKLHEELLYRNFQHDYIEREGGHKLEYWQNALPYHLLFFNRYFQKANGS
jgi:S-formylglutathione hydrolase FrmB